MRVLRADTRVERREGVVEVVLYIDGAAMGNPGPAGVGFVVRRGEEVLHEEGRYVGEMTNNMAEYRALIAGLEEVLKLGAERVRVYSDSQLVVYQMQGRYGVKSPKLALLHERAKELAGRFSQFEIFCVDRSQIREADRLAHRALLLHQAKLSIQGERGAGRMAAPADAGEESPGSTGQDAG